MLDKEIRERLIFGTARMHHIKNFKSFDLLINEVLKNGINKFDIAPLYGYGITERNLSLTLSKYNCDFFLNTKTGIYFPRLFFYNYFEYWLRFLLNKFFSRNNILSIDECDKQVLNTYTLFKNKAILNSICLHEPSEEFIINNQKSKLYINFLKENIKTYNIENIGISGSNAFHFINHNNNFSFDIVQTSAKAFLNSSDDYVIKSLRNIKTLNLYGLRDIQKEKLKIKLKEISEYFDNKKNFNFIFSTKFPYKIKIIIDEIASVIDYVY